MDTQAQKQRKCCSCKLDVAQLTIDNQAQLQVAKETGAKFAGVFYVDSLSPPDGQVSTYLRLLEYNVNTLIKGLRSN